MQRVRELDLGLDRVLLRRFSRLVADDRDLLELSEQRNVLGVDLEGARREVVVVEEKRGHRREPEANSGIVVRCSFGFTEGRLTPEPKLAEKR